jgi:flavorubredoxin
MHNTHEISPNIYWVGGSERRLSRFENMFPLNNGIAYNSFVIVDDKTVLLDTVDISISDLFLSNVKHALNGRTLDYLVINHMEPDHCANIVSMVRNYPEVKLIGNTKTFQFFEQFYDVDLKANYMIVKDQDELNLGQHTLKFYTAAMVHWPEVMMTYEKSQKILFSADAFGTFGGLNGGVFADECDFVLDYLSESRRYYANIVGKFGGPVQAIMNKLSNQEILMICPLHGPLYRGDDLGLILNKYEQWSTYKAEVKSVLFVYASMYNNTEVAVDTLANKLARLGVKNMKVMDISQYDLSYVIAEVWKYSNIVLATPTYNADVFYKIHSLLHEMAALNVQNRKFSLIFNSSWGGKTQETVMTYLEKLKNISIVGEPFNIKSSYKDHNESELDALAKDILDSLK